MHIVIGPTGRSRKVKYVLKLAEHVEVYIIGVSREWVDFWPLDKFIEENPEFTEYRSVK